MLEMYLIMGEKRGLAGRVAKLSLATAVSALVLSGCAQPRASYIPYPSRGTTVEQYNRNVMECEAWASRQAGASSQEALNQGAQGAAVGAGAGALLGLLFGGRRGAGLGAATGAIAGAGAGGVYGSQQAQAVYDMAFRDCMAKIGN
jgi:hypothetical protein